MLLEDWDQVISVIFLWKRQPDSNHEANRQIHIDRHLQNKWPVLVKCPDHENQRRTNATFQTEDWKTWHTNACFGTGYFWYKGCYCNNWISVSSSVNHKIKLDLLLQISIRDLSFCIDKTLDLTVLQYIKSSRLVF